jgi:hypothetical protein
MVVYKRPNIQASLRCRPMVRSVLLSIPKGEVLLYFQPLEMQTDSRLRVKNASTYHGARPRLWRPSNNWQKRFMKLRHSLNCGIKIAECIDGHPEPDDNFIFNQQLIADMGLRELPIVRSVCSWSLDNGLFDCDRYQGHILIRSNQSNAEKSRPAKGFLGLKPSPEGFPDTHEYS